MNNPRLVQVKDELGYFHGWGSTVTKIGNIIENKWFDMREFFEKKNKENENDKN